MKEYKSNQQLIEYLISKNILISDKEKALKIIEKYSFSHTCFVIAPTRNY